MTKIYWCLIASLTVLVMSSFECSKQGDDITEETNVTVDFTQFPSHTTFILTGADTQGVFKFDSDSAKIFNLTLPAGEYKMQWKLIGLVADHNYKAKWLNTDQGTVVPWEDGVFTFGNRSIHGTYTFTKERK